MTATYNPSRLDKWWADVQKQDNRQWFRISAEFGEFARTISGRDDIIGAVQPGKGDGAPGVYLEESATVELNPDKCAEGVDPADIHMDTDIGRHTHPVLSGVGFHEAGHAAYSRWSTRYTDHTTKHLVEVALLLEETRMEKAILADHPDNRALLRAASTHLNLAGLEPFQTVTQAAHNAALLLGRVDAGVFDADEMDTVETMAVHTMGLGRLMAFRHIWRQAHQMNDHTNRTAMLELAQRWIDLLPENEKQPADGIPILVCAMGGDSDGDTETIEALLLIADAGEAEADDKVAAAEAAAAAAEREKEAQDQAQAATAAKLLHHGGHRSGGRGGEQLGPLRQPTPQERARANQWGKAIRNAQHRDRTKTTVASTLPPGRLKSSAAVRRSAQQAIGIKATAQPWRHTIRKHVDNPPLTVGIICDISGSMSAAADPVASTAWSLAHAVHQNEGDTATLAYGNRVHPVVRPRERPTQVRTFDATGGTEEFVAAVNTIDGAMHMHNGRGARLLVIISDGHYRPHQYSEGQRLLRRLTQSGVKILWLGFRDSDNPMQMPGVHYLRVRTGEQVGTEVARAIQTALKDAVA